MAVLPQELAASFATAIREGRLRAGQRLPTIRALAAQMRTTRATVQAAYRLLRDQGLAAGVVGQGTTVCSGAAPEPASEQGLPLSPAARAALEVFARPLPSASESGRDLVADFASGSPDHALFPVREFQISLDRVLGARGGNLLGYGDPGGHKTLREVLATRCGVTPDRILITSGAQQGLDLVLRAYCASPDAVLVPAPSYHHWISLARVHGLEIVPIPCGDDGIDLEALAAALPRARLLHVMPTFHNPTGRSLTSAQREALMKVVAKSSVPVLADEFQEELRFSGTAPRGLAALDPRGLTITVHTFSKGLFPGVRIGWLEASPRLLAPLAALKRLCDLESSSLLQAALADFLSGGVLDRHLATLRKQLALRHAAAQDALAREMPEGSSWTRPEGGFSLWLELPRGVDAARCAELCSSRGVLVTPGRVFDPLDRPLSALRLSIAHAAPQEIVAGVRVLGECVRECLTGKTLVNPPLFL